MTLDKLIMELQDYKTAYGPDLEVVTGLFPVDNLSDLIGVELCYKHVKIGDERVRQNFLLIVREMTTTEDDWGE